MVNKMELNLLNKKTSFYVFLFLFCMIVNYSFGYIFRIIYTVALFIITLSIKNTFKNFYFVILIWFLTLLAAIYYPIGQIFGSPCFNTAVSLFATNYVEVKEFLFSIPLIYYLFSLFILILGIFLSTQNFTLHFKRQKWFLTFAIMICLHSPVKSFLSGNHFNLVDTGLPPVRFISEFYKSIQEFKAENKKIISALNNDTWGKVSSTPHYSNYILVIGESARKDFMHTYGFSIENTPFSDRAYGIFFTNYLSAGSSTQISLNNTLALHENDQLQLQNNIISLANKAGFQTYWLSSQGSKGIFDTGVANLARKAMVREYLKPGESKYTTYFSDENLLPLIKSALNAQNNNKPKLIVVHLMGSHPPPCSRTNNQFDVYFRSKDFSCYIQSIKNTDTLLEKITKISDQAKEKWSMMYFSDHGLTIETEGINKGFLHQGSEYKQNFEVPLFIISSDSTKREKIITPRSAFSFLTLFSEWTGIKTEKISDACHFSSNSICKNQTSVIRWDNKIVDIKEPGSNPVN